MEYQSADGWETFQAAVSAGQTEAVAVILKDGGVAAVLDFSESVESPRPVGSRVGQLRLDPRHRGPPRQWRPLLTPVTPGRAGVLRRSLRRVRVGRYQPADC